MRSARPFQSEVHTRADAAWGLPARLDPVQTARVLGFQEHDIPVLVLHGLLEPLGKPAPNARKYFAAVDVCGYGEDRNWLNRATRALYQHWQDKNANRTTNEPATAENLN